MRAPFSELILEADVFLYGTAAALVFNRREHPGERIEGREEQATRSVRPRREIGFLCVPGVRRWRLCILEHAERNLL